MCYTKSIVPIITYSNGATIYLSNIEPFSYSTLEIEKKNISVIISLLEEKNKPYFLRESINKKIYEWIHHYYYNVYNYADYPIENLFDTINSIIYRFLNKGMNILIHCRSGISISPTILTAFFIRSIHYYPQYIVYDIFYFIPKTKTNWTDSFIDFIRNYEPEASPNGGFLEKLYIYENNFSMQY